MKKNIPTLVELMKDMSTSKWECGDPGDRHEGYTVTHPVTGLTAVWHFRRHTNTEPAPYIEIYQTRAMGRSAREYLEGGAAPVASIATRRMDGTRKTYFGPASMEREFARWIKEDIRESLR